MTDKHKSKKELENEGKETVEIFQDLDQTALKTEMFIEKYAEQIFQECEFGWGLKFRLLLILRLRRW